MNLWQFFLTIFKISSITFGGGYTIVPVIRDAFVDRHKLLDDEEMLDLIALGQTVPGPIAVSTALLVGYRLKGRKGALVGILAAVLPPFIIISILYFFYEAFASNVWVRAGLRGMSGAISAIMINAVYRLAKVSLRKHRLFSAILMIATFAVSFFTSINKAFIVLTLGLVGYLTFTFVPEEKIP